MKIATFTLLTATLLTHALPASADRLPMPANTPASYRGECSSCHMAYPPALLNAEDWQKTMQQLNQHFGTDAAVDAKTAAEISNFLQRNAGSGGRLSNTGNPPRISQTAHFVKEHRKIPERFWSDPRIQSVANCEACHQGAANGRFSEHDMRIPELRR